MQSGVCSGNKGGVGKDQELGYNEDLQVRRYRDRDMGRDMICQGWNSSTESVENDAEWHERELEKVGLELV